MIYNVRVTIRSEFKNVEPYTGEFSTLDYAHKFAEAECDWKETADATIRDEHGQIIDVYQGVYCNPNFDTNGKYIGTPPNENGWTP